MDQIEAAAEARDYGDSGLLVQSPVQAAVQADPGAAGHPSGLRRAKPLTSQHTCPHSFVVLYRWQGLDQQHPHGVITIEELVERF